MAQIATRLSRTQKDIAKVVGKARNTVSTIVNKFGPEEIKHFYNENKSPEQIAKMFDIDVQTVMFYR